MAAHHATTISQPGKKLKLWIFFEVEKFRIGKSEALKSATIDKSNVDWLECEIILSSQKSLLYEMKTIFAHSLSTKVPRKARPLW